MRFDLQIIAELIDKNSRVLDLGCGKGDLMEYLRDQNGAEIYGIEKDEKKVIEGIERGLPILHGDINLETQDFADQTFDYVILSQTLQQVYQPETVITEILRIGKKAVVSFPCFNHLSIRLQLLFGGKAPVTEELPYQWFDTPNIRVITLKDFRLFCSQHKTLILKEIAISSHHRNISGKFVQIFPDLFAKYGVFLITGINTI
ncbi:MAG: methionine biosynthesis protein MetW [Candidatus Aminicenantes bacterium]|nr:methionine biosynthesis protein MetW [Candidatus Aminicenantes bacterium]